MFDKVLIANRGEDRHPGDPHAQGDGHRIGRRLFRRPTVDARHVREADQAYPRRQSPPRAYLNIEKILAAAAESGAEAIHPGYGFLAENAPFARACEERGLCFPRAYTAADARLRPQAQCPGPGQGERSAPVARDRAPG